MLNKVANITEKSKIVFVHRMNDYGGTSLIISGVIQGLVNLGYPAEVYAAESVTNGFLTHLDNVKITYYKYNKEHFRFFKIFNLIFSQAILFFRLLKYRKQNIIFYINTIFPFGAALAGLFMKKRVIYHVHEISLQDKIFYRFCKKMADICANEVIYVSDFLQKTRMIKSARQYVVRNALSPDFIEHTIPKKEGDVFTVLMICNLVVYKGVLEFVKIARLLPQYRFELVVSADDDEINTFFKNIRFSENLLVHGFNSNVHRFYARANLVVNLSHPDKWLESFGMTILEAMHYELPVIVPTQGGIAELVIDDFNGYHVAYSDTDRLVAKIIAIADNHEIYLRLSRGAKKNKEKYNYKEMIDSINQHIIGQKQTPFFAN